MTWKQEARSQVLQSAYGSDPESRPRYFVPDRRFFWEIWKPRWRLVEGVSRNDLQRAYNAFMSAEFSRDL